MQNLLSQEAAAYALAIKCAKNLVDERCACQYGPLRAFPKEVRFAASLADDEASVIERWRVLREPGCYLHLPAWG